MAPRDAPRRPAVKRADSPFAIYGTAAIIAGIVIAWLIDAPALRFLLSATAIAIGFGLIRRAFRLE